MCSGRISELNSLSHYYCELALQDIDSGRIKEATKRLNSAQEFSENAIRPLIMLSEIKIKEGEPGRKQQGGRDY